MHLDLAGVITTEKRFHASEKISEQHFFSHVTIFRRKNVLAGISRRPKIPERALNFLMIKLLTCTIVLTLTTATGRLGGCFKLHNTYTMVLDYSNSHAHAHWHPM